MLCNPIVGTVNRSEKNLVGVTNMCQVNVPQEVNDVVAEFVSQNKVFTAYDVTVAARKRTSHNVRHADVRLAVMGIINNDTANRVANAADYVFTMLSLNDPSKGNPQVIVYHPLSVDPYTHPMVLPNTVAPAPVDDGSTVPADDGQGNVIPFDGIDLTVEGRLNIPKKVLSQACPVGGSYDIKVNGTIVSRFPNLDGRVRLGKKVLDYQKGQKYQVEFDTDLNCIKVSTV
jgi:hypothetical protein